MNKKLLMPIIIILLLISACMPVAADQGIKPQAPQIGTVQPTQVMPTPQPTPVNSFSIEALAEREYGLGELVVEYPWHNENEFTRYYITYDSDGLTIHGFVNIPKGSGPFPVVIALHGYIPPQEYTTLDYSTRYADSIARKGYIVLHPNMRNFPPSDSPGRVRDFQTGYTVDVLNLLEYVRQQSGQPGSIFEYADMEHIGIWGHSLGGGVALRTMSLVKEIKAAVLYAAVSQRYTNDSAGFTVFDLDLTDAAFSVHHGTDDETIDVDWSYRLCDQLADLQKDHECFFYEGSPHTFYRLGQAEPLFIQRTINFFNRHLKDA